MFSLTSITYLELIFQGKQQLLSSAYKHANLSVYIYDTAFARPLTVGCLGHFKETVIALLIFNQSLTLRVIDYCSQSLPLWQSQRF